MPNGLVRFAALLVFLAGTDVRAQSASDATLPRFEVASVKPTAPNAGENICRAAQHVDAGRLTLPCATLSGLVSFAYGLTGAPEGGPAWGTSGDNRYRLEAKAESAVGMEQLRIMLQALLADRFQLKVHRETPMRPVFALVVVKGGIKMHGAESGTGQVRFSMAGKEKVLTGSKVSVGQILPWLKSMVPERPIVDETGLTGTYDFKLQWLPDSDQPTVSFSSALPDQLGLKLEDRKAPVEILVVDYAEKPAPDQ